LVCYLFQEFLQVFVSLINITRALDVLPRQRRFLLWGEEIDARAIWGLRFADFAIQILPKRLAEHS
jgi:hypothetical protein